jgi:ligand-binding SRPBCC domain-containing protein
MKHFEERAIGGRISGLITLGETVTWRAKHFLLWHEMTVKITQFEYPKMFCDEMVAGPFKFFRHEHIFTPVSGGTVMTDILHYALPFPLLTTFLDVVLLRGYMKELLLKRNAEIKGLAENVSENNLA